MQLRQTVIVRTDLGFTTGLYAAQVSHIHMEAIRQSLLNERVPNSLTLEWLEDPYIYVHGVPNKEALDYFENKARAENDLDVHSWTDKTLRLNLSDNLKVDLADVKVGISLGPSDADIIRRVIGDLPIL